MKKRILAFVVAASMVFTACGSLKPCAKCGDTPAKGYKNTVTGEKEYYCGDCTSECMWCQGRKATKHYTSIGGQLMFVCDECYEGLHPDTEQ